VRDAAMMPMRKLLQQVRGRGLRSVEELRRALEADVGAGAGALQALVTHAEIAEALAKISSSVGDSDVKKFEAWSLEFGAA
jgi:hypothetical protein